MSRDPRHRSEGMCAGISAALIAGLLWSRIYALSRGVPRVRGLVSNGVDYFRCTLGQPHRRARPANARDRPPEPGRRDVATGDQKQNCERYCKGAVQSALLFNLLNTVAD